MFNNLARVGAMRVAVLGSGNFGSVIARNVARNLQNINEFSVKEVKMWVHDEQVNGKSLVDIINDERVNVKYLPGVKLPDNVIATRSIEDACSDADILLFIVPHQYLPGNVYYILDSCILLTNIFCFNVLHCVGCISGVLSKLKGNIKPSAIGVSMIKSLDFGPRGPKRCSELIQRYCIVHIHCCTVQCNTLLYTAVTQLGGMSYYITSQCVFHLIFHPYLYTALYYTIYTILYTILYYTLQLYYTTLYTILYNSILHLQRAESGKHGGADGSKPGSGPGRRQLCRSHAGLSGSWDHAAPAQCVRKFVF